jgi:hypothetical protein
VLGLAQHGCQAVSGQSKVGNEVVREGKAVVQLPSDLGLAKPAAPNC